jgi:hypothetical protein
MPVKGAARGTRAILKFNSSKKIIPATNLANWMTRTAGMSSCSSPIRSRSKCPLCGSPLYYTNAALTFLTGKLKRQCLAANCSFRDAGHFKIAERGYAGRLGVSKGVPRAF